MEEEELEEEQMITIEDGDQNPYLSQDAQSNVD